MSLTSNTTILRRMSSDARDVRESCIEQSPEAIVTRAVIKLWRTAYHSGSLDALNSGRNPP